MYLTGSNATACSEEWINKQCYCIATLLYCWTWCTRVCVCVCVCVCMLHTGRHTHSRMSLVCSAPSKHMLGWTACYLTPNTHTHNPHSQTPTPHTPIPTPKDQGVHKSGATKQGTWFRKKRWYHFQFTDWEWQTADICIKLHSMTLWTLWSGARYPWRPMYTCFMVV